MSLERFARIAHTPADRAALATRAGEAVRHDPNRRNPQSIVERVNAYGAQADVMVLHPAKPTTERGAA